jgi:hypothetical protein
MRICAIVLYEGIFEGCVVWQSFIRWLDKVGVQSSRRIREEASTFGANERGCDHISAFARRGRREECTHYPVPGDVKVSKVELEKIVGSDEAFILPWGHWTTRLIGIQYHHP